MVVLSSFSGFSVGFCINEETVICYQVKCVVVVFSIVNILVSSCILVHTINSDTLFYEDFKLPEFIAAFHHSPCKATGGALVASYNCKDEGSTGSS